MVDFVTCKWERIGETKFLKIKENCCSLNKFNFKLLKFGNESILFNSEKSK